MITDEHFEILCEIIDKRCRFLIEQNIYPVDIIRLEAQKIEFEVEMEYLKDKLSQSLREYFNHLES